MIPNSISHYEIVELLGEGGMGTVYRAVDTRLGRPVAIKVLRGELAADDESRARFMREARAASALNHPHIITIYDIGRDRGTDFIAMEYVAGLSLADLLGRARLEIPEALNYGVQIADALAAAHAAGIVHRDLKPANIIVSDKRSIKVADFGLAKLTESGRVQSGARGSTQSVEPAGLVETQQGTILGTTAYMSPEQAEGLSADARSDVFALGAVLYEMVTGRRAFHAETRMSTLAAILTKEPDPPGTLVPQVSRELEKVIARCLRKDPERRWQSMADLKIALEELRDEPVAAAPARPTRAARGWRWLLAGGIGLAGTGLLVFILAQNAGKRPDVQPRAQLTRLTSDVAWTDFPAISPDGKLLAYASDRSGDGNLDIWLQQIPDGAPARLTRHAADEFDPSFSADGRRIAFQSSRDGGGVYVASILGGEERLLARGGYSPRFSPDGASIAYGVQESIGSRIYVAPAAGGPPRAITDGFHRAQAPVWSADGRHLLFRGQRERDAAPENNVDWYVVATTGGAPVRTGARQQLTKQRFEAVQGLPFPDAWVRDGTRILFHGHIGDSWNIWQLPLAPGSWQVDGAPQRVTFGTTDEAAASVALDGRMVFISRTRASDVWMLPIDPDRSKVTGPLKRVTADAADDYDPTVSADAATLVFRSRRAGRFDVVLKNLSTGAESVLTQTAADHRPALSGDGTKVAYSLRQDGRTPIFVVPAAGGAPQQLCGDCGDVEQWSPDGSAILYVKGDALSSIGLLQAGSAQNDAWLTSRRYGIYNPRFAPDGGWVAFNGRTDTLAAARLFVARVRNSVVAGERDWTVVAEDAEAPAWSPDGGVLYFWSDRDGSPCLWAMRLDAQTRQPAGPPVNVLHFHSRGLSWKNLYLGAPDLAVARDRILLNLGEHTGNIWMTDLPPIGR